MNPTRHHNQHSKPTPAFLTAMGKRHLPSTIEVNGTLYQKKRVFKNDFFAVTAQYESDRELVILKVHRQAPLFLLPLGWLGCLLAARERAAFLQLEDVEGIPKFIARWKRTGVIRAYIEGHPLQKGERVDDDFHTRLRSLIDTLHERGLAYVDLEKCENVLVGADGKPHLFDFQIAWLWPKRLGSELWPMRKIRQVLQAGDLYHLVKLQRRTRPDQLSKKQLANSYRKPWYMGAHRSLTFPFTWCRRKILDRIDPRRGPGERGRVHDGSVKVQDTASV